MDSTQLGICCRLNMKVIFVFLGLCAVALAVPTSKKWISKKYKMDDSVTLDKQLKVLKLFKYIYQPIFDKDVADVAVNFHPEDHLDLYTVTDPVKEFLYYQRHLKLPKGSIFSVTDYQHLKQAVALFKTFYYAKDFDSFYKTAVWARTNVNEEMFVYSVSVAIVHREDTFGIILPPIYEIIPYYFFNTEVVYKAQQYKQIYYGDYPHSEPDWTGWTITSNYSGWYLNLHPDQHLSYLTEDIGFNSLYYYYHIFYPFWLDGTEFGLSNDHRGQLFYAMHQYLWARYYSERVSHGLPDVPILSSVSTLEASFYPSLTYSNSLPFPSRPPNTKLDWETSYNVPYYNFTNSYINVLDYFRRMRDALSLGYVYTHAGTKVSLFDDKGIELFANLVEGNPDSPDIDYYGIVQLYVRHILGYTNTPIDKDHLAPAAVEHYETALRDPAYWYFVKWIVYFFQEFKMREQHHYYTKTDLQYDDVKIESVQSDRFITYFEWYYSDLSNGVFYNYKRETEPFHVRVRQQRLNHKPFTYTVNVQSSKPVTAVVRVFLGPKYDTYGHPIDINHNRLNFYIIDKFIYHLPSGKSSIVRNSKQIFSVSDRTSYWQLYKRVSAAIKGTEEFIIDGSETFWGLPNRLVLPAGSSGGTPYQMYVIITPYVAGVQKVPEETYYPRVGSGLFFYDNHAAGFPFDKPVAYPHLWDEITNAFEYDVNIYHKGSEESLNLST